MQCLLYAFFRRDIVFASKGPNILQCQIAVKRDLDREPSGWEIPLPYNGRWEFESNSNSMFSSFLQGFISSFWFSPIYKKTTYLQHEKTKYIYIYSKFRGQS